jgi:hypothetical protein
MAAHASICLPQLRHCFSPMQRLAVKQAAAEVALAAAPTAKAFAVSSL